MKPYVYLSTGKSRDVQRDAPYGARIAVHFPDIGRTIELEAGANGHYWLTERPAPGLTGEINVVAQGDLDAPIVA